MIEIATIHDAFVLILWLAGAIGAVSLAIVAIRTAHANRLLEGHLFEVVAPEGGGAPEQFFMVLHGLLRPFHRRVREGQPWIALELWGARGRVHFAIWIPDGQESFVSHLLRAAYPGIELRPLAVDPLAPPTGGFEAVATVRLHDRSYLPIGTTVEGDSLASLLSTLSRAQGDERIHISLLVRPRPSGWQASARQRAHRLRSGRNVTIPGTGSRGRSAQARHIPPTAHELEQARLMEEKSRHVGFDCTMRAYATASENGHAREYLRSVAAALRTFHGANSLAFGSVIRRKAFLESLRARRFGAFGSFILTPPELAALWHLPVEAPPHMEAVRSPKLPPPPGVSTTGRMIGVATYPGHERPVALSIEDGRRHLHVVGPTGTGKTTLLASLALQDLAAGRGVGIIDPKGDLVEAVLERFPRERLHEVVLIAPEEADMSIGINPLEWSDPDERDLIAENTLAIFKRIYERHWGMRTDDILKSALITLLRRPDATICHVPLLLSDKDVRSKAIRDLDDPIGLASFWKWFEGLSEAARLEAIGPVLNKLRDFLVRPRLRRLLCQSRSTVDLQRVIDSGGVLLANLSTGRWGDQTASLLGSFLVAKIWQAVRHRAHVPEAARRDFMLYVDEFQQFLGIAGPFADTLAQARSFRLSLTLANQHLGQLPRDLQEALSSNARSRVAFQCGQDDARYLAREFAPLDALALQAIPRYEMAARLSIAGETSRPFTARTLPLPPVTDPAIAADVAEASRRTFGRSASDIDEEMRRLLLPETPEAQPHVPKAPGERPGRIRLTDDV